jgi:spore maturation protein CgeB
MKLDIVIFGLSITSSWGNGHATTYRALCKALERRGHQVTFFERDVPWYAQHRDLPRPPYCRTELYQSVGDVCSGFRHHVRHADLVILGSYVPDGRILGDWITKQACGVTAFYDIDTPVTLAALEAHKAQYISAPLIPRFDLYLSFTGGPALELIETLYGSPRARPLYCGVDPELHRPVATAPRWALGYLGTHSEDRAAPLQQLLIAPAQRLPDERFVIAGAGYPAQSQWPGNVEHIPHLAPDAHPSFYCAQRFTLNLTRAQMVQLGFSPSVRLFEAAACGVPIISDRWAGLDTFFTPGEEILIADTPEQVTQLLRELPEAQRRSIADAALKRVLASHTADKRAQQLEQHYAETVSGRARRRRSPHAPEISQPHVAVA